MTTRNLVYTIRPAQGGLDITSDPTVQDPSNLIIADNITYKESGQRKKRPGMLQYSPSSSFAGSSTNAMVSSSSNVRALADTWDYSTGLVPVQRMVAVTGASIFRSTGDGLWTAVTATSSFGSNATLRTNIMMAEDYAVIADGVTQPIAYNLRATTLVSPTTGANWPIFEASQYHLERMFYWGVSTAPSRLYYTAAGNIFDSTGGDAGSLSLDKGDGDRITGVSNTFFGNLYVFKGPQFGSVHEISGQTSTEFVKKRITTGTPAHNHHAIVTTDTDIFWISHFGVHSLKTTLKFGNVEQSYISLPIQDFWRKSLLDQVDLSNAKGFWHPNRNIIGWIVTPTGFSGAGARWWILIYNYALSDPTPGGKKFWSIWKVSRDAGFGLTSVAQIIHPSGGFQPDMAGEPHIWYGTDTGMVMMGDWEHFEDDGSPYPVQIRTPVVTRFRTAQGTIPETQEKQFTGFVTFYSVQDGVSQSHMNYSAVVDNRDAGNGLLTLALSGTPLGSFILGTSRLGGIGFNFEETIIEGRGRGIYLDWSQAATLEDFEILGYALRFAAAEAEPKEAS